MLQHTSAWQIYSQTCTHLCLTWSNPNTAPLTSFYLTISVCTQVTISLEPLFSTLRQPLVMSFGLQLFSITKSREGGEKERKATNSNGPQRFCKVRNTAKNISLQFSTGWYSRWWILTGRHILQTSGSVLNSSHRQKSYASIEKKCKSQTEEKEVT